jgi:hypothetical protein
MTVAPANRRKPHQTTDQRRKSGPTRTNQTGQPKDQARNRRFGESGRSSRSRSCRWKRLRP